MVTDNGTFSVHSPRTNGHLGECLSCSDLNNENIKITSWIPFLTLSCKNTVSGVRTSVIGTCTLSLKF